jgi:hypothetical protein
MGISRTQLPGLVIARIDDWIRTQHQNHQPRRFLAIMAILA